MNQATQSLAETERLYLSRGIDYLGDLGAKLRDLAGFATLAYELIQNADDAEGATAISFDVRSDALVVDNDGVFTDCQHAQERQCPQCPWKESKGHLCDFHRFRLVASADKREQEGTIGAFGIGFIAVYQITDKPGLISNGHHWILHEDQPEEKRIEVCPGCETCQDPNLPKTRFILPWARDPESSLRKALRAEAVPDSKSQTLLQELEKNLPRALPFLAKIRNANLSENGIPRLQLTCLREGNDVIVSDGKTDRIWYLFHGNFAERADQLREQHGDRIEAKRQADVAIAIPDELPKTGLLYATLPTEHDTGLPFHINADFYPTSDRKKIVFGADYQSQWNRAAVESAALVLKSTIGRLPGMLKPEKFWGALKAVQDVHAEAGTGKREEVLGCFWLKIEPELSSSRIVLTSTGNWVTPQEAFLLLQKEEEEAISILESLGLSIVHADLRPHFGLLRSKAVGTRVLGVLDMAQALRNTGLHNRVGPEQIPDFLNSPEKRAVLWREIARLLGRRGPVAEDEAIAEIRRCAIAMGNDGALWPCGKVYRADDDTVDLFGRVNPDVPFLRDVGKAAELFQELCQKFSVQAAIDLIEDLPAEQIQALAGEGSLDPVRLLGWFESRRDALLRFASLRERLAELPIFPTSTRLRPLTEISLPGDFKDPLGLADVVDVERLSDRRDFLRELGAEELTIETYAQYHVPRSLSDPDLPAEKKKRVIRLLADRLGELRDSGEILEALRSSPIVECADGQFREPANVYFPEVPSEIVRHDAHFAVVPEDHEKATRDFYRWLGVSPIPKAEDVMARVRVLTSRPPNNSSVVAVQRIFEHLGQRTNWEHADRTAFADLRRMEWLPAKGDGGRWCRPGELSAVFQDYLFESQGTFLGIDRKIQEASAAFMRFLRIGFDPEPRQVVQHLLARAEHEEPVNNAVYAFLNDRADDPALNVLKGRACLLLPSEKYVRPDQVFWANHPFGRFRYLLGHDMRKYSDLFERLGVKDTPDHHDALNVIQEIASEYGEYNRPLDEDAFRVVLACWQMISRALETGNLARGDLDRLAAQKVIPNTRRALYQPEWVFFADRAGLAEKFGPKLIDNVIQRPEGAWRGMEAAGVRSLRSAVKSHIVECEDPQEDTIIIGRLRERRLQILRIMQSEARSANATRLDSFLADVKIQAVQDLKIQYSLNAFKRQLRSDPEAATAHYHKEDEVLYYTQADGSPPWQHIARELALALCPDEEPRTLGFALRDILGAQTEEEARTILDDMNIAPMAEAPRESTGEGGPVITGFGGQSEPEAKATETAPGKMFPSDTGKDKEQETQQAGEGIGQPARERGTTESTAAETPQGTATEDTERRAQVIDVVPGGAAPGSGTSQTATAGAAPSADPASPGPQTADEAVKALLGPGAKPPTPMPSDLDKGEYAGAAINGEGREVGRAPGARISVGPSSRCRRPVLRTYVLPEGAEGPGLDAGDSAARKAVDRAGVDRVLAYEKQCERHPKEMPPQHKGYDVESGDSEGNVVRYIEVKSLSGKWSISNATLTKPQFDAAMEVGSRFWLYVVERAQQDDFRIFRINDPARRVDQFIYDDGWRDLSEDETAKRVEKEDE